MKTESLKERSKSELLKLLQEKREKLCKLRFGLSQGKVKNVKEIRGIKKEIARILTRMNQKSKNKNQK